MKKTLLILSAITSVLIACGDSSTKTESTSATTTTPTASTSTKSNGEVLIAKSDCIGCHHKENKIIGPSYQDIANKYEANDENTSLLAQKIIEGGKGVWGTIPMTPHPKITEPDAKEMVKYILSLKK